MMMLASRTLIQRTGQALIHRGLSSSAVSLPLLLSLPKVESEDLLPKILFPRRSDAVVVPVSSEQDILDAVEAHYQREQFVGGMGESDEGVWFLPTENSDPLRHFEELIKPSIAAVKQSRHGVPFGVYTSGTVFVDPIELKILSTIHVSLLAGTPMDYCEAAGIFREELFGDVCNFFVDAQDEGLPIHAGVVKKFANEGRELATALGAQHVDIFDE